MAFFTKFISSVVLPVLAVLSVPVDLLKAQDTFSPEFHTGRVNIDLFGGWGVGAVGQSTITLPNFNNYVAQGSGTETGGAGLGVALNPSLLFTGEVTQLNGSHQNTPPFALSGIAGLFTIQTYTRAQAYDAGLQIAIPKTKNSPLRKLPARLVPYAGAGVSTLQNRASVLVQFVATPPVAAGTQTGGATAARVRQGAFAINSAIGARWYFNKWFGLRVEGKGYFPTGTVKQPLGRLTAGIFFQFR